MNENGALFTCGNGWSCRSGNRHDELLENRFVCVALLAADQACLQLRVFEDENGGDRLNIVASGEGVLFVDIDPENGHAIPVVHGELGDRGFEHLARSAPGGVEVNHHHGVGPKRFVEVGFAGDFDDGAGVVGRSGSGGWRPTATEENGEKDRGEEVFHEISAQAEVGWANGLSII